MSPRPLVRDGGQRQREYPQNRVKPGAHPVERINRYVQVDENGCWIWQGSKDRPAGEEGYGQVTIDGTVYKAHRVSFEAHVGPIPAGLHIDHLCRVRACVNPLHLEPVTALENNRRSPIVHGRKTHCPQGHSYDEANTYAHKGRRYCRACRRARIRAFEVGPSTAEQREERKAYRRAYRAVAADERARRKAAGLPVVTAAELARFATQGRAAA